MKHNGYFIYQTIIDKLGCTMPFNMVCMDSPVIIIVSKKYTNKFVYYVLVD